MRSCGGKAVMSSPKKRMLPEVGAKSPVTVLKSVVLPAPLEPRMAYFWPAATAIETSSTARSAPKARVTWVCTRASLEASGDGGPGGRMRGAERAPKAVMEAIESGFQLQGVPQFSFQRKGAKAQ